MPRRNKDGEILFADYPEFRPNLSPREMFELGSFGGTYWRPIYSSVTGKDYKNQHKKYPKTWWKGIPDSWLVTEWDDYDKNINKYGVKVEPHLSFGKRRTGSQSISPMVGFNGIATSTMVSADPTTNAKLIDGLKQRDLEAGFAEC